MERQTNKKPPMANGTKIELWKSVAITLLGICGTAGVSWVAYGSRVVTKEEILHIIKTQTPYVMEREYIRDRLQSIATIALALDRVKSDVVTLNVKMDLLMAHIERTRPLDAKKY